MTTINDKKVAVSVTNTTESVFKTKNYTNGRILRSQSAAYQNHQAGGREILKKIPESNRGLTTYLIELLKIKKAEQQQNTFRFPTPESPGKIEDHIPIQTQILETLNELIEKIKP